MDKLEAMSETIPLARVTEVASDMLDGKVRGRLVVEVA
jgi:D-arabinose 1-dehydrogenase-like Zn-dependent alcohol dehydrogenase